jgi:hypothetical protein
VTDALPGLLVVLDVVALVVAGRVMWWLGQEIRALKGNVTALEGTVRAQRDALDALGGLNKTALEVVKAIDPERWAKEVTIHKELNDKKTEAVIEGARRRLDQDMTQATAAAQVMGAKYQHSLVLSIGLLCYVPMGLRDKALRESPRGDGELIGFLLEGAPRLPDLSADFFSILAQVLSALPPLPGPLNVSAEKKSPP